MKNFKVRRLINLRLFLLTSCLTFLVLEVKGLPHPQWVWNKDAIDNNNRQGNNQQYFVGQSSNLPVSPTREYYNQVPKQSVRLVDGQPRFFSGAVSTISNSIQSVTGGNGGGSSGGGISGIFGAVLQNIPQLATQAIGGLFGNRPINLPAKHPDDSSNSGSNGVSVPITGSCKCVALNACFLPAKPNGSCDGGKVQCCSTSRTIFPEDGSTSETKSEKTVTQREVRRGLLQNILKGSGSLVDDTLDLILAPFLSKEDQQKIATRVIADS